MFVSVVKGPRRRGELRQLACPRWPSAWERAWRRWSSSAWRAWHAPWWTRWAIAVDDPELHAARKTTTASTTSPAAACPPAVLAAAPDPQIADAAGPRLGQPCRLPASSGCPHCRDRDSPSPFSRPNDLSRVLAAEREHQPRGQMRFPRAVPGRGPAPRGPDPGPLRISVTLGRPAGSGVRRIVCRYLCQLTASRGRCRLAGDGPRRGRWPPRAEACRACRSGLPSHKCRRSAPGPTPEFSGRGQDGRVLLMLPSCHGRKTA